MGNDYVNCVVCDTIDDYWYMCFCKGCHEWLCSSCEYEAKDKYGNYHADYEDLDKCESCLKLFERFCKETNLDEGKDSSVTKFNETDYLNMPAIRRKIENHQFHHHKNKKSVWRCKKCDPEPAREKAKHCKCVQCDYCKNLKQ